MASASPMSSSSFFDIVAGGQDLQQIAAGHLLVNFAVADGSERRQRGRDRAFMAPRQHPFETQLHHQHVACERRLDGSARQPWGFAIEQSRRGERRLVSRAPPPARGIA
jgi:hypothetical protein